jgi:hypothetical protein
MVPNLYTAAVLVAVFLSKYFKINSITNEIFKKKQQYRFNLFLQNAFHVVFYAVHDIFYLWIENFCKIVKVLEEMCFSKLSNFIPTVKIENLIIIKNSQN